MCADASERLKVRRDPLTGLGSVADVCDVRMGWSMLTELAVCDSKDQHCGALVRHGVLDEWYTASRRFVFVLLIVSREL